MSTLAYIVAPVAGYLVAGSLKFVVNSIKSGRPAFSAIGLGGFPSTHNTIVATIACLVGLREGVDQPAFGVALALAMIVAIDALDLRRKVGRQAEVIKALGPDLGAARALRTQVGHRWPEVIAGWITGAAVALSIHGLAL